MGDPRKIKNKFSMPMHPWQATRLEQEKPLMKVYGLSNKRELWKVDSKLKNFKDNAKKLVVRKGEQAETEKKQLTEKLKSFNLISSDLIDDILGIGVEQLLNRRLQTLVFKKGLARTTRQARQMITHGHINVGGKKMTSPGYLVKVSEENSITYTSNSTFENPDHPERKPSQEEEIAKEKEKVTAKKKTVKKDSGDKKKDKKPVAKKEKVVEKPVVETPVVEEEKSNE